MDISMEHATPFEWNVVTLLDTIKGNIGGVVNAISKQTEQIERIANALDRAHPKQLADLTCGELMAGVGICGPETTLDGAYTINPDIEFHDGLYANGGVFRDRDGKSWFALDVDQELKASNPQELREIAELFRTSFAGVLDFAAREWEKQIVAGEVTLDTKEEA